jgi:cytochrome c oxidase subunit II
MIRASQSTLDASAGSAAELIERLGSVLYVGAGAILIVVLAFALWGVFGAGRPIREHRWVLGGGIVFPSVVLTVLLVHSLKVGNALDAIGHTARHASGAREPLRVHVIGHQWWWEVHYEQPGAQTRIVLANELHLPIGRPVELSLSSADVIHSFWVPALAGKVDMIPGRTTRLVLKSHAPGKFRGQCAEYCGGQHAWMALFVVAESEEQFAAWLARQGQHIATPSDPFLRLGYDSFFKGGCDKCHAVRGTPAVARLGPDLTHVGSRESLAAGMLENHAGTMAGWIAGAQEVKPGNFMPSMAVYSGRELRAVSAWLESLE